MTSSKFVRSELALTAIYVLIIMSGLTLFFLSLMHESWLESKRRTIRMEVQEVHEVGKLNGLVLKQMYSCIEENDLGHDGKFDSAGDECVKVAQDKVRQIEACEETSNEARRYSCFDNYKKTALTAARLAAPSSKHIFTNPSALSPCAHTLAERNAPIAPNHVDTR